MKSFVVMTYYHFMHATAMALNMDEKPNLYFAVNYLNIDEDIIQRIRETEIFNSVTVLDHSGFVKQVSVKLEATKNLDKDGIDEIGSSIFEEYLEPYYAEKMANADMEDEIFVYNDFQFYYYYVSKHFKHVVGVEDGYRVLEQQTRVHKFKGVYVRLLDFIEAGYYPRPLWRHPNVDYIISSCEFDDIDPYYTKRMKVMDFYDLIEQNRESFVNALKYIFDVDMGFAAENASILIGQPLDRCQYCTPLDYYLFNRKLIEESDSASLVVKPHPAERLDFTLFEDKGVTVINKSFPIEVLNYCDVTFEEGISFDSTSLRTLKCIKKSKRVLDVERPSFRQVKGAVQRSIEGQQLTVCVVVKINGINYDSYVNAYTYFTRNKKVRYEVILAIGESLDESAEDYYEQARFKRNLRVYLSSGNKSGARKIEVKELLKGKRILKENTGFHMMRAPLDDEGLLRYAAKYAPNADYFFCTDASNLGLMIVGHFDLLFRQGMRHVVEFPAFVQTGSGARLLNIRNVENMACHTSNTLLYRSVLLKALDEDNLEFALTKAVANHPGNVTSVHRVHLSDSTTVFLEDFIDVDYFADRIARCEQYAGGIDAKEVKDEFLTRMYSSIIDEYISWQRLTNGSYSKDMGMAFIDCIGIDPELKERVVFTIADALYTYRDREYSRFIYRENLDLTYYRVIETWLFHTGVAKSLETMRRSSVRGKRKLDKKIRSLKKEKRKVKRKLTKTVKKKTAPIRKETRKIKKAMKRKRNLVIKEQRKIKKRVKLKVRSIKKRIPARGA